MKFTQSLLLCGVATVSVVSAPSLQGDYNGCLEPIMGKGPAECHWLSVLLSTNLLHPNLLHPNLLHVNPTNVNPPSAKKLYAWVEIGNGWYLKLKDYDVLTKEIRYMCPFYPDKRLLLNDVRELIKTVPYNRFEMSEEDFVDRFARGVCVGRYWQANAFFVAYADKEFDRYRQTPQGSYDPLREKVSEILDRIWKMPYFAYANEPRSQLRKIISQGCEDVRKLISGFRFKTASSLADHVCHILENYESHLLKKEAFFSGKFRFVFEHDVVDYDDLFRKFSDLPSDANAISVPIAKRESTNSKDRSSSDAFLSTSGTLLIKEYTPTWQKIGAGCYMKSATFKELIEVINILHDGGSTIQETWAITRERIADDIPDNAISDDIHNLHADYETVRYSAIMDPMYIPYDEIEGQKRTPQRTFRGRALKFFREYLVKVYGGGSACRRADEHF